MKDIDPLEQFRNNSNRNKHSKTFLEYTGNIFYSLVIFSLIIAVGFAIYHESKRNKNSYIYYYTIDGEFLFKSPNNDSVCYEFIRLDSVTLVVKEYNCKQSNLKLE